jgi:hypothetical protein
MVRRINYVSIHLKTLLSIVNFFSRRRLCPDAIHSAWIAYSNLFLKEIKESGLAEAIRLFKLLHTTAMKIAAGEEFDPLPFRKVVKGKGNIPLLLKPLITLLQGDKWDKRLGLTLSSIYTLGVLAPSLDTSTITSPGAPISPTLMTEFTNFVAARIVPILPPKGKADFLFGSRAGPNGPAVPSAHLDAVGLRKQPQLLAALRKLMSIIESPLRLSLEACLEQTPDGNYSTGRLAFLPEKGGKTRIIAIVDFWSQQTLKPFHEQLLTLLASQDTDCTFDQNAGFTRARILSQGKPVFSFDLSSATDRFPLDLQVVVMTRLYGPEVAQAWKTVIAERDFVIGKTGQMVRWARGQPLGAYSSWVVFALTHHLLIQFAAFKGCQPLKEYEMLGDDVIIWNEITAGHYKSLCRELDIPISELKSLVSPSSRSSGEFTKRIFTRGVEISPIPLSSIQLGFSSLIHLPNLLEALETRWGIPSNLVGLYASEFLSHISTKGIGLLRILMSFRSTVRGISSAPWCSLFPDHPTLLRELRMTFLQEAMGTSGSQEIDFSSRLSKSWGIVVPPSLLNYSYEGDSDPHPVVLAEPAYKAPRGYQLEAIDYTLGSLRRPPDYSMTTLLDRRDKVNRERLGRVVLSIYFKLTEKLVRIRKRLATEVTTPAG